MKIVNYIINKLEPLQMYKIYTTNETIISFYYKGNYFHNVNQIFYSAEIRKIVEGKKYLFDWHLL